MVTVAPPSSGDIAVDRPGPEAVTVVHNGSGGMERAWFAAALSSEVTDQPIGVQVLGRRWALVRLDDGLTALEDRCPHRLAPLSIGINCGSELQCRYHGWKFNAAGRCVEMPPVGPDAPIPGRAQVATPAAVMERYGIVWIAPVVPVCDLPEFPEWDDPAYDRAWTEPCRTPVSFGQLVDNFADASHFPTVHMGTFGTPEAAFVQPHEVERDGWEVRTTYRAPYKNYDDPLVETGEHPLVQPHVLEKAARPPSIVMLRLHFPLTEATIVILFACTPESPTSTRVYKMMARNDFAGDEARLAAFVADEEQILVEDLVVLEAYPDMVLHLDLRTEVHTKADKLSVAYRRLLSDFVTDD
ncbi:MAG: Methylxanthine N1-demethylase NdmA [Acidimicrobiales bacterium]|nr:Methylxanthine N1-demethylase NdmA [Acidimicrobiales bacterium]